jgi:hypothetical protein
VLNFFFRSKLKSLSTERKKLFFSDRNKAFKLWSDPDPEILTGSGKKARIPPDRIRIRNSELNTFSHIYRSEMYTVYTVPIEDYVYHRFMEVIKSAFILRAFIR